MNNPYYGDHSTMDFIAKFELNFARGNIIKYVVRAGKKSPDTELDDLRKARDYLDYEIFRLASSKTT